MKTTFKILIPLFAILLFFLVGMPTLAAVDDSQSFIDTFKNIVNGPKLMTLMGLVAADFLFGVLLAIKEKTFAWSKLSNYLNTSILLLVGGYYVFGLSATFESSLRVPLVAAWAGLSASLLAMVLNKAKGLGLPLGNQSTPPAPSG